MNLPEKQTILVVDDMRTNVLVMKSILSPEWNVKTALDGETALQMTAEEPVPDLILLDISMPDMDGYEVCRRLKQDPKTCEIPIIFITAREENEEEVHGLELGAADYITKPIHKPIVLARARNQLALRHALTELALKNKELECLATHDKLTGLFNRRRLDELLAIEIDRAGRYGRPLSLIVLDIDRFKTINDTHGHLVGDLILTETAEQLKASVRSCDMVGRWGGDEFVIICPETPSDTAFLLSKRLCHKYSKRNFSTVGQLTVSLGVASYRKGQQADDLLSKADTGLYRAKQAGRNQAAQEQL